MVISLTLPTLGIRDNGDKANKFPPIILQLITHPGPSPLVIPGTIVILSALVIMSASPDVILSTSPDVIQSTSEESPSPYPCHSEHSCHTEHQRRISTKTVVFKAKPALNKNVTCANKYVFSLYCKQFTLIKQLSRHRKRSFTRPCPSGTDFRHGNTGETRQMSHAKAHMARQHRGNAPDVLCESTHGAAAKNFGSSPRPCLRSRKSRYPEPIDNQLFINA